MSNLSNVVDLDTAVMEYVMEGGLKVKTVAFNEGTHLRTKGNLELVVTADPECVKKAVMATRDIVANNKIQYLIWLTTAKHARINEGDVFTFTNGLTVRYCTTSGGYCGTGYRGEYSVFGTEFEFLYWLKRFF